MEPESRKSCTHGMGSRRRGALIECLCFAYRIDEGQKAKTNDAHGFQIIEIEHIIPDEWISFLPNASAAAHTHTAHTFNTRLLLLLLFNSMETSYPFWNWDQ